MPSCAHPSHASICLLLLATACGATHLRLTNTGTSEGPLYRCDASSCEVARTDDPERINQEGTVFIALPDACPEMSGATLHRGEPAVDVTCGGTGYRCAEDGECVGDAPPLDGGMSIAMPTDCGGRIHEVLVVGATDEQPTIFVQCDTSGGAVIGEM